MSAHLPVLMPCPICGGAPERITCGTPRIEVIHCPKGCKPDWNRTVVHLRSVDIVDCGWTDLGHAWNTARVIVDDGGRKNVSFDLYAPGYQKPPTTSERRRTELAALRAVMKEQKA